MIFKAKLRRWARITYAVCGILTLGVAAFNIWNMTAGEAEWFNAFLSVSTIVLIFCAGGFWLSERDFVYEIADDGLLIRQGFYVRKIKYAEMARAHETHAPLSFAAAIAIDKRDKSRLVLCAPSGKGKLELVNILTEKIRAADSD